jgi:hypothetical protein
LSFRNTAIEYPAGLVEMDEGAGVVEAEKAGAQPTVTCGVASNTNNKRHGPKAGRSAANGGMSFIALLSKMWEVQAFPPVPSRLLTKPLGRATVSGDLGVRLEE